MLNLVMLLVLGAVWFRSKTVSSDVNALNCLFLILGLGIPGTGLFPSINPLPSGTKCIMATEESIAFAL